MDQQIIRAIARLRDADPDAYQYSPESEIAGGIEAAVDAVREHAVGYLAKFGSLQGADLDIVFVETLRRHCRALLHERMLAYRHQMDADRLEHAHPALAQ